MELNMKSRLRIISLFPILILFILSAFFLYYFTIKYITAKKYKQELIISQQILQTLKSLGKERTLSALYLAKTPEITRKQLKSTYDLTDQNIWRLKKVLPKEEYGTLLNNLAILKIVRKKVEQRSDDFQKIFFALYTNAITQNLLQQIQNLAMTQISPQLSRLSTAYSILAYSLDYSSIEEGAAAYYTLAHLLNEEKKKQLLTFATKADAFSGATLSNTTLKQLFSTLLQQPNFQRNFEALQKFRLGLYEKGLLPWKMWLSVQEKKIDELNSFALQLRDMLLTLDQKEIHFNLVALLLSLAFWILSFILLIFSYLFTKDITWNIKKLEEIIKKVALSEDLEHQSDFAQKINLESIEGINKAYELLELALKKTEDAKEAAQEANKAKSMFLANMSHEIRTPLNGIMGFTDLLKNTPLTEEQKEFVSIIEKSSENLLEIINNILDIAKIESNKIEIESVVFEPIQEFENAVEVYAPKAAEKGINLAFFIDPHLEKPLKGDPTKIKEVLINLISNAVKFTPKGGEIAVEIKKIGQKDSTAIIHFEVRDTGIGIPKDKKEKIFEAFSQADISVTRKYGGTGLGLTISSEFVKLMGGKLKMESEEGKGSRFFFTLELEEIPVLNETYQGRFEGLKLFYYEPKKYTKIQTRYIEEYCDFFGVKLEESQELQNALQKAKECNFALLDFDFVDENRIKTLHMQQIPVALISKVTFKKRVEELMGKIIKNIYEPVNYTKLKQLLEFYIQNTQKLNQKAAILAGSEKVKFKAKALVAEDNIINQKLIKKTLEDFGLEVDLADNGLEAIEKFKKNQYDIIFMDIQMPIKDGIEALQEIHLYEKEMHLIPTPIIALTAHALKGDRERFMKKGFDEYITKPINRKDIETILKAFLPDKKYVATQEPAAQSDQSDQSKSQKQQNDTDYDILLLKKSPLESKLFANVLKSLGYRVDIAMDLEDLEKRMQERKYKVVFIDKESDHYNFHKIQKLKQHYPNISFILLVEPSFDVKQLPSIERDFYDDIVKNIIQKEFFKEELERLMKVSETA